MADTNYPSSPLPPPSTSPTPRRSLFWPLILIGGGLLALLFNLGLVDWYLVGRLTGLWPLLLILLGAQLLLRGAVSRRVASATGAILLLLVLVWMVAGIASIPRGFDSGAAATGGGRTTAFSGPAGELSAATLELSSGAANITVAGADLGSDLYRVSMTLPAGEEPLVELDRRSGILRVETPHRNAFRWPFHDQRRSVQVTLANRVPWQVRGGVGATNGSLDLSRVKLAGLQLQAGASRLSIRLPEPTGTMPVGVSGGALQLTIMRPAGAATQVTMDGGASNLTVDGHHFPAFAREGVAYASSGYGAATDRIDIQVQSGASNVVVTS